MNRAMTILLACLNISCIQSKPESLLTGEYAYWSQSRDFETVRLQEISQNTRRILIKGKGDPILLTGKIDGTVLRSSESSEGTSYIFRLEGRNELRMQKIYRNHTSPEDIEWIFYRVP